MTKKRQFRDFREERAREGTDMCRQTFICHGKYYTSVPRVSLSKRAGNLSAACQEKLAEIAEDRAKRSDAEAAGVQVKVRRKKD